MWDIESCTKRAKKSWVTFWLEKLAVLATVAGIGFGVSSLRAIEEEREAREEERKIWYWTLLATPAPGNSGKIEALQYLASNGTPLRSIDLSCRAMRGGETVVGECERPVYLEGLDLSKKTLGRSAEFFSADLSYANLSGANLHRVNLSDVYLIGANLSGANLSDSYLRGANLSNANLHRAHLIDTYLGSANVIDADLSGAIPYHADLRRTYLRGADLSDANLLRAHLIDADLRDTNLSGADLSDVNLSNANFSNAIFSSDTTFTNAWAWADEPPRNLPATIQIQLCKYNTEGSSRYLYDSRPVPCIPPDTTK